MGSQTAPVMSAESAGSPTPAGNQAMTEIAPSSGAGSGAPSPGAPSESPNIRQLREQYEALKGQYAPYEKLGKPEEIQTHVSIATKLSTDAIEAGTALGYDENQIREALAEDPGGTIAFLRNKQMEAEQNNGAETPDIKKLLKEELSRELKPFYQEREQQAIEKAHGLFDTAFDAQISELFKDDKPNSDELNYLYEMTFHLLQQDPMAVKQLKSEGKTSGVAKLVQMAKTAFDKAYLSRNTREMQRIVGTKSNTGTPSGNAKRSLDDIIQGNFPEGMKFQQ